jgi:hypothetical protein
LLFLNPNRATLVVLAVVALVASTRADEQSGDAPQTTQATQSADDAQQPNAAPDQQMDNQVPPYKSNPPIVGLHYPYPPLTGAENRSYLLPGAQFLGGIDGFEPDGFGHPTYYGSARGLGSLSLQKLWRRYDLDLDYLGGVAYLGYRSLHYALLQSLDAEQHISWRTGQLAIRDSFNYLPEGNFGAGAYGAVGALSSLASGEGGLLGLGIFGPGTLVSLGEQPRIMNVALADVTQYLSPKSSIYAAGSYGFVHFTGGNLQLINSQQVVAETAYNRQLSRKNQIAVFYGYQMFRFPGLPTTILPLPSGGRSVETNLINVLFGRRINDRMEVIGGAGPQITDIHNPLAGSTRRVTISGRASFHYRRRTTDLFASFARYNTNGAGLFGGATTNLARFAANRPFRRVWLAGLELGYTHERSLINFFGNQNLVYEYGYVGGGLHRQLSRELSAFVTYQFGNLHFNSTLCVNATSCGRLSQREVVLVGLDWHPHPIRLD